MVVKNNDWRLQNSGSNTHSVGQDPVICRSIREKPHRRFEIEGESYIFTPFKDDELASFHEALSLPNASKWMAVTKDEINLMEKNKVWKFVDLLIGCKSIRNK